MKQLIFLLCVMMPMTAFGAVNSGNTLRGVNLELSNDVLVSGELTVDTDALVTNTGNVGIGTASPTARLNIGAGTTTVAPLKLIAGTALTTPQTGAIEFHDNRLYVTNKSLRKAIDRTSDIKLTTTTVAETTTETTVFTASVPANSWVAGNLLKMYMFGEISNTVANDQVTIKIKVGGTEIASVTSTGRKLTNTPWIIKGDSIVRTVGTSGDMAWIMSIKIDGQDRDFTTAVGEDYDTTGALDITVTATWDDSTTGNSFSCTGGWMEYKN